MCGIAGVAGAAAPLEAMAERLRHRGPDARRTWRGEGMGMAHARLSILDLEGGSQPYASEDGRVVGMFNGEIYNFRELRRELEGKGHRFRSRSDGEVIVHLYEEEGDALVERLRGMFALAVWDQNRSRLLLARDRLGVKPLVYVEKGGGLWFASEPKALTDVWRPKLGPGEVRAYLCHGYLPGVSFLGLQRLPPGHRLAWEGGAARVERYGPFAPPPASTTGRAEAVDLLETRLAEATRIRLVSDVPVGAFLSGGLDSSLVTALMRREGAGELHSFSIAIQGQDETAWARLSAGHLGTLHHERPLGPEVLESLPAAMAHLDEPMADASYLACLALAGLAREHVKVCLSGDGADEAFLGYRRYAWIREFGRNGPPLRPLWRALGLRRWGSSPQARYADIVFLFSEEEADALLAPAFRGAGSPVRDLEASIRWASENTRLRAFQAYDYATYLAGDILPKVDLSSMAASLEVRSPFLDAEVQAFAASLPVDWILGKGILKDLARRFLPAAIVDRPKQGFELPLASWLGYGRGRRLLDRLGGPGPYFDPRRTEGLLGRTEAGDRRSAIQCYALLAFLGWARGRAILAS